MDDPFDYEQIAERARERARLGIMREALEIVANQGLFGEHHFYITFQTGLPGVNVPAHLAERYSDEMTIVLQHQFWNLTVTEDRFSVDLSFSDEMEHLEIPFAAVVGFVDPSAGLALRFQPDATVLWTQPVESTETEEAALPDDEPSADAPDAVDEKPTDNVVALDRFRKR